jgi:hypothetical protein
MKQDMEESQCNSIINTGMSLVLMLSLILQQLNGLFNLQPQQAELIQ